MIHTSQIWQATEPKRWIHEICNTHFEKACCGFNEHRVEANEYTKCHIEIRLKGDDVSCLGVLNVWLIEEIEFAISTGDFCMEMNENRMFDVENSLFR